MELSYGWTSSLAQGLRALRDPRVLKAPRALRALQDHRAHKVLRGQQAKTA